MRRLSMLLALGAVIGVAANSAAHPGHSHAAQKLTGTVKAVHAAMNHVELTTKDGKSADFYVNADTKYSRGSTKLSLSDLTPGTRVVVEGTMDGEKMVATSVKVGAAAKTPTGTSSQPR